MYYMYMCIYIYILYVVQNSLDRGLYTVLKEYKFPMKGTCILSAKYCPSCAENLQPSVYKVTYMYFSFRRRGSSSRAGALLLRVPADAELSSVYCILPSQR